ncbi:MAG: aspartate-semialdehyde dehydrogenase [Nitrososphaerota archaeon]|nr:aspartate-semialdehyde dehydrogenase [Nitrososphaerota archaeon]
MRKIDVALLGATGSVGQRYVSMLAEHPYFRLRTLVGRSSAGKKYGEAVKWMLEGEVPAEIASMRVEEFSLDTLKDCGLIFSALPSEAASSREVELARIGKIVVSEASAHRMDQDVPLLIPEVNPQHLLLLERQRSGRKWDGGIVTTPNCTAVGLDIVLAPLVKLADVKLIVVNTMQAISGAGYLGVPSMSILENVIPFVKDEEEKVVRETAKILGRIEDGKIVNASMPMAVSCNRVSTIDGHLESLLIEYEREVSADESIDALSNFTGEPQKYGLPTAPSRPIIVRREQDRPQPRIDRMQGSVPGMSVVVGRVRRGAAKKTLQLTLLSHNTIRGAAGGAILTAELMYARKLLQN